MSTSLKYRAPSIWLVPVAAVKPPEAAVGNEAVKLFPAASVLIVIPSVPLYPGVDLFTAATLI